MIVDGEILIVGYDAVFLAEARASAARSHEGKGADPNLHAGGAASAVTAACSAVEAFVSERAAYYRRQRVLTEEQHARIATGDDPVYNRLNRLVRCVGGGDGIDRHDDYEPFQAVVALRNCFVHRKADYLLTDSWPDDIEPKHRAHIPYLKAPGLDWTSRVFHEEVADWAVGVVSRLLESAETRVPRPPRGRISRVTRQARDDAATHGAG